MALVSQSSLVILVEVMGVKIRGLQKRVVFAGYVAEALNPGFPPGMVRIALP
jgi:hypothetical protein